MQKVHSGHDILSVLCPPIKAKPRFFSALTEKVLSKGILISIVSAFLIVLASAFALRFASVAIEQKLALNAAAAQVEQKVGWLPGQYIASEMGGGYLNRQ